MIWPSDKWIIKEKLKSLFFFRFKYLDKANLKKIQIF